MREQGVVVSTNGLTAEVQFTRGPQCQGCHACDGFRSEKRDFGTLLVRNVAGARPGERVEVEIAPSMVLTSAFMVFIFPLLALAAAYAVAVGIFGASQTQGVLAAFGGLVLSLLLLRFYDRHFVRRKNAMPVIVRKVTDETIDVVVDPAKANYWP